MVNVEKFSSILYSTVHSQSKMQAMRESYAWIGKDDRKSFEKPIAIYPALSCGAAFSSRPQFIRGPSELRMVNGSLYFFTWHDCGNILRAVSSIS